MFAAKNTGLASEASPAGYASTASSVTGIRFASNTAFTLNSSLPSYGTELGACNSSTDGYWFGGGGDSASNAARKLSFINSTTSTLSATLTTARTALGAVNSTTNGYIGTGYLARSTVDRLSFADDSISSNGTLTYKIRYASMNSSTRGYFACGTDTNGNASSSWRALSFSTNSLVASGSMSITTSSCTGMNSTTNGYVVSGTTISRLAFSSEASATISATTSVSYSAGSAFNSLTDGYFCGTTTNMVTFASETCQAISANVGGQGSGAGCQSGGIL